MFLTMKAIKMIKSGSIVRSLIALGLSLVALGVQSSRVHGAEKVKLIYGPFNGKISVDSLEKFATTGEMTREFKLYAKFIDRETLETLGYWLNSRFECDRVTMYRFAHTAEGEQFFQDLGTVIKTHPQRNGFMAIRSALIEAADVPSESDGWTILEAMHNFPTEDLQIHTGDLFKLQKSWSNNPQNNQAALEIFSIREESTSASIAQ
ncbi:MAG: alpha/beta hydrolase [Cyanobacteria bacterium J06623_7]